MLSRRELSEQLQSGSGVAMILVRWEGNTFEGRPLGGHGAEPPSRAREFSKILYFKAWLIVSAVLPTGIIRTQDFNYIN